jgi:hypothetical protein
MGKYTNYLTLPADWTDQKVTITPQPDSPLALLDVSWSTVTWRGQSYWKTIVSGRNGPPVTIVAFELHAVFTTAFGDTVLERSVIYDKQSGNGFMAAPANTMTGNSVITAGATRDFWHGGVLWTTVVLEKPVEATAVTVSVGRVKFADGTIWTAAEVPQ